MLRDTPRGLFRTICPPSHHLRQPCRLIDGPLGVQFPGFVSAADEVHFGAGLLQGRLQRAQGAMTILSYCSPQQLPDHLA